MSEANELFICESGALEDGGKGVRFPVQAYGRAATGFVVRHGGQAYAYLNRCAHVPVELDWFQGDFFESTKTYLMCATHGAIYVPENGACVGGPCRGGGLQPIRVREADGQVVWTPDGHIGPPAADAALDAGPRQSLPTEFYER